MNQKLLNAFSLGIKPEQKLSITEWARENVFLAISKKSNVADLDLTPWLKEPLQTVIDGEFEDVILTACTGAGKSTLIEILTSYIILEKSGPLGIFMQTSSTTQAWVESRLMPMLRANPKIAKLFPKDRHKIKKDSILFPHMPLYARGPSPSNTQSLTLDGIILDECFLMSDGVIDYVKKRNHDRAFSWMLLTSQPGKTSSDFHRWWSSAKQMDYHYKCPVCGEYHKWEFKNLVFDKDDLSTIYYQCPCGAKLQDHVNTRREMSCNGKYVERPTLNTDPRRIAYNFSAGLKWDVSWNTLVREFLAANDEKKKGNYEPLEKFRNQRLCEWWSDEEIDFAKVETSGYSLTEREKWDKTFLTVDVQGQIGDNLFWYAVRTFNKDGDSRLLDFGRFASYQEIVNKQKEWGLIGNQVAIDSGHKTDEVKEFCAVHGYVALKGVNSDSFPVVLPTGKTITRIYGKVKKDKTLSGRFCAYAAFAANRVKTLTAGLRSTGVWQIPSDIPEFYIKQLQAETLENGVWKQNRRDNHAIDLDSMTLILALIHGVKVTTATKEDTAEE